MKDLLGSFDLPLVQTSHCLLCGLQDLLQTVHLYSQVCWNTVCMCPVFVWVRIDEESEIRLVIMAKIATLAYRHFDGSLPPYLSSSLCTYEPSRSLRFSNEKLLKIPKQNLKSFGQRSFSFMAPSLWNSLLATLRNEPTLSQFKSQLKTFLFAQAFL